VSGAVGYRSTRDPHGPAIDFEHALLQGLAPDGGLYIPDRLVPMSGRWREAGSLAAAAEIAIAPYLDPQDRDEWLGDLRVALDFPVPVRHLGGETYLLELFHGPTRAFKDVAARTLGRWWARALARRGRRALVLVATSGDTGSAVAAGMAGIEGLEVVVLFPNAGVSPVQRAQLTTPRAGVSTLAVEGSFDDCQRLVKLAFQDAELGDLPLTSANSINLGRWLPQMAFHVWGLAQLAQAGVLPERTQVVVPSGNLGNLVAGVLAAASGAAPASLVAAHNANRYLVDHLAHARSPFDFPATVATHANAMDVGAPSNFERLQALWGERLPLPLLADWVEDPVILERMRATAERHGVLVCPHTAVGLEVAARLRATHRGPQLVLATAHAAKFPEVLAQAIPGATLSDPLLDEALAHPGVASPLAPELRALRRFLRARFA
jgi:threonine synthase